jgi:hypothetical protein
MEFDYSHTLPLAATSLFRDNSHAKDTGIFKHMGLSYMRGKAVAKAYG